MEGKLLRFYSLYGKLGKLEKILNSRALLSQRESSELKTCDKTILKKKMVASKQFFASSPTSEAAMDFSLSSNFLVFEAKAKAFRRLPLRQRPQQTL